MELEIIILRKISQAQKDKYHIFVHMQNLDLKNNNMTLCKREIVSLRNSAGGWMGERRGWQKCKILYEKFAKSKKTEGVAQVVKYLRP
jgi:hypothetical protein